MTQPDFTIRRATRADIAALVELGATTFRDAYRLLDDPADIDDYVTNHFTPTAFATILDDAASTLLVAESDQRLVGYMHIRQSIAPSCVTGPAPLELARLYLRQESIGKGFGKLLMQAVYAEAKRLRCKTIWLSVYDRNLRAVEFYKRWGFFAVGTKEFAFGGKLYNDPVMMSGELDS